MSEQRRPGEIKRLRWIDVRGLEGAVDWMKAGAGLRHVIKGQRAALPQEPEEAIMVLLRLIKVFVSPILPLLALKARQENAPHPVLVLSKALMGALKSGAYQQIVRIMRGDVEAMAGELMTASEDKIREVIEHGSDSQRLALRNDVFVALCGIRGEMSSIGGADPFSVLLAMSLVNDPIAIDLVNTRSVFSKIASDVTNMEKTYNTWSGVWLYEELDASPDVDAFEEFVWDVRNPLGVESPAFWPLDYLAADAFNKLLKRSSNDPSKITDEDVEEHVRDDTHLGDVFAYANAMWDTFPDDVQDALHKIYMDCWFTLRDEVERRVRSARDSRIKKVE